MDNQGARIVDREDLRAPSWSHCPIAIGGAGNNGDEPHPSDRGNAVMMAEWPEPVYICWDWAGRYLWPYLWDSDARRHVPEAERDGYAYGASCERFLKECIAILREFHPGCRFGWNHIPAFDSTHVHLKPWPSEYHTNALHRYAWREQEIQREIGRVEEFVRERGTFLLRRDDPDAVEYQRREDEYFAGINGMTVEEYRQWTAQQAAERDRHAREQAAMTPEQRARWERELDNMPF